MMRNEADSQADHERFVRRVVAAELVLGLRCPDGWAQSCSNEEHEAPVLLFWSDAAYARRVRDAQFQEFEVAEISLFDFIFRWLPGMAGDGALAGTNWTRDLVGGEVQPADLQDALFAEMGEEREAAYRARCKELNDSR